MITASTLHLYGLELRLPVEPPPDLVRPPAGPGLATFTFQPGAVSPLVEPAWTSDDEWRLALGRRAESTVLVLGEDRFEITGSTVTCVTRSLPDALDFSHNVLAAALLAHASVAALHACVVDIGPRVAIVGESGAGKSTLGRRLLAGGGRLVADDLLALDGNGHAHQGPPFTRSVQPVPGAVRDRGGKHRVEQPPEPVPARPVDLYVVLDARFSSPTALTRMEALDALLGRPYLPAAATASEPLLRLQRIDRSLDRAATFGIPPRFLPPAELGDLVAELATGQRVAMTPARAPGT